ncbi:MAG TPA: sodium/proton-translocating pyrophosphatase, partial [Bryobacteraceae bacterium]|nr:sodium/proton-translocating pyrophosphatase [Bryobacteraceae bacterium]
MFRSEALPVIQRQASSQKALGRPVTFGLLRTVLVLLSLAVLAAPMFAQEHHGGEANLILPDLDQATFLGGIGGRSLLMVGLLVSGLGLLFGLVIYRRLRDMPVHAAMREVSELIYETCKTYLATQGKFLMMLEALIAVIIVFYFGFLQGFEAFRVGIILLFSVVGISGSFL